MYSQVVDIEDATIPSSGFLRTNGKKTNRFTVTNFSKTTIGKALHIFRVEENTLDDADTLKDMMDELTIDLSERGLEKGVEIWLGAWVQLKEYIRKIFKDPSKFIFSVAYQLIRLNASVLKNPARKTSYDAYGESELGFGGGGVISDEEGCQTSNTPEALIAAKCEYVELVDEHFEAGALSFMSKLLFGTEKIEHMLLRYLEHDSNSIGALLNLYTLKTTFSDYLDPNSRVQVNEDSMCKSPLNFKLRLMCQETDTDMYKDLANSSNWNLRKNHILQTIEETEKQVAEKILLISDNTPKEQLSIFDVTFARPRHENLRFSAEQTVEFLKSSNEVLRHRSQIIYLPSFVENPELERSPYCLFSAFTSLVNCYCSLIILKYALFGTDLLHYYYHYHNRSSSEQEGRKMAVKQLHIMTTCEPYLCMVNEYLQNLGLSEVFEFRFITKCNTSSRFYPFEGIVVNWPRILFSSNAVIPENSKDTREFYESPKAVLEQVIRLAEHIVDSKKDEELPSYSSVDLSCVDFANVMLTSLPVSDQVAINGRSIGAQVTYGELMLLECSYMDLEIEGDEIYKFVRHNSRNHSPGI